MAQRQSECKFGLLCNRLGCPFGHSLGRNIDLQQQAGQQRPSQQQGNKPPSFVPCKFGAACNRAGCHFMHPSTPLTSTPPTKTHPTIPCKFGSSCTRADCCFLHEPPAASQQQHHGAAWNQQGGFQPQGAWQHQQGPTRGSAPLSALATTPCKFGLKCTNSNCHFLHPLGLPIIGGNEPAGTAADDAGEEPYDELDEEASSGYYEYGGEGADLGREESGLGWEEGYGDDYWGHDEEAWGGDHHEFTPAWEQAYGTPRHPWADLHGPSHESPCNGASSSGADSSWVHNGRDLGKEAWGDQYYAPWRWQQQQQLQQVTEPSPPEDSDTRMIKADMVGPALMRHLRAKYGDSLHTLRKLLLASQLLWDAGQNALCAAVQSPADGAAAAQLRDVVAAARDELSQELRELPVVGGTRLVLSPGGAISMVLTSAEFVTVSVTGIAISTTEAELRARFAEFGQVLRVGLHHVVIAEGSSDRSARPLSGHASAGGPGQQKASSWARVTFREPAFAEAAVLAQERLGPWKLKGARPAPMDHTFVQHGQRLKVTWRCGRPAGVAFVQMATPKDAQAVLRKLPRTGPSRNMLPLGHPLGKAFVSLRPGMDRTLLLKLPRDQREWAHLLTEQRIHLGLGMPAGAVGGIALQYTPLGHGAEAMDQSKCQIALHRLFAAVGELTSLSVLPVKKKACMGCAIIRYKEPQACFRAVAALHDQASIGGCKLAVELGYCMTLAIDARTLRAVRSQLSMALERLRSTLPSVSVVLLERDVAAPSSAAVSAAPRASASASAAAAAAVGGSEAVVVTEALVKISGEKLPLVMQARGVIERELAGRVFQGRSPDDIARLLTPAGKAFLLGLESEHSRQGGPPGTVTPGRPAAVTCSYYVHIKWERQLNRLRLYGPSHMLDAAEEAMLRYLEDSDGGNAQQVMKKVLPLSREAFRQVVRDGTAVLTAVREASGATSVALDLAVRGVVVTGSAAALCAAEVAVIASSMASVATPGTGAAGSSSAPLVIGGDEVAGGQCPICMCDLEQPYSLAACGHCYCRACLEAMLASSTRSNSFPVHCCAQGCGHTISLADLSCLLPAQQLVEAFRAAFRVFVESKHEAWGCCLSPDCPQVYKKGVLQFQCDCCLATWCTGCLVPFHHGQSCQEHHAAKTGDKEFEAWKQEHTKPCPSCKAAIEKSEGCNHMTCSKCKSHFCWLCGELFADAHKTYDHLAKHHGGIFDAGYGRY